jgi:transcriptional regulator with XRE-family HTH domain
MFVFSGERLREARLGRDLSREQLAVAATIPYASVLSYEHGFRRPSRSTLLRLATALGVCPRTLVEPDPAFEEITV